jgi:UDP-glucose 4-epimerase
MKIVITGALGHIGSYLIRELPLSFSGVEIVMIDNLSTQRYCSLFDLPDNARYSFVEADILTVDLNDIFREAAVVVHLAAITNAEASFGLREEVEENNYNATVKVAQACEKNGCPMVHLSSTSVYGSQKSVVDEDCSSDELKPQSPYAESKLKEEEFLKKLGEEKKFRFVVCRFGTICGVSRGMRFHTAVNKFCWQAVTGQTLTVWRTALHQKRPYLELVDAVRAFIFIIKNNLFINEIFNIVTENLAVNDLIQMIKEHLPEINVGYVDAEIMNQLSYEVSTLKIKDHGFDFKGNIRNGVDETIRLLQYRN